jgi:hypothetical protein
MKARHFSPFPAIAASVVVLMLSMAGTARAEAEASGFQRGLC